MLTVSAIGSASGASSYYGKDDYYVTGEAGSPGVEWSGEGAERAGLSGKAEADDFRQVIDGSHEAFAAKDPDNQPEAKAGNNPDQGVAGDQGSATIKKGRNGFDMTFSMPKSMSVVALVGGDQRLLDLHDRAVERAMAYAEKNFAETRVREDGKVEHVRTGNLVFGKVQHITSRSGDPNVHTHCIVAPKTWHEESQSWRALESRPIFQHMKMLGAVYRAEMAKGALALGYNVEKGRDGLSYEIAGVPKAVVSAFSQRHNQISEAFKKAEAEKGRSLTGPEREHLVLKDRPKKLSHTREGLEAAWREKAKEQGFNPSDLVKSAVDKGGKGRDVSSRVHALSSPSGRFGQMMQKIGSFVGRLLPHQEASSGSEAFKATRYSIRVAEEGSTVFSSHSIIERALQIGKAGIGVDDVVRELDKLKEGGWVKGADKTVHGGLTTKAALDQERTIMAAVAGGKMATTAMLTPSAAMEKLAFVQMEAGKAGLKLNEGQVAAASHLLTSRDRFVGVQGFAGVGKTTMFRVVADVYREQGRQLVGMAPTHAATSALQNGAGIPAQTIQSWLTQAERYDRMSDGAKQAFDKAWRGTTLLADESSMQSNAMAARLIQAATKAGIERVILIGDERQLGSPEAGAPWRLMLNEGLSHKRLDQIVRQQDPKLLEAVNAIADRKIGLAFKKLDHNVIQIGQKKTDRELASEGVKQWQAIRESKGIEARIIVPTNGLRHEVGREMRAVLQSEGTVGLESATVDTLKQERMTKAEAEVAGNYKTGQVLIFHKDAGKAERGKAYEVVGCNEDKNTLTLKAEDGRLIAFDPKDGVGSRDKAFEAYNRSTLEVACGERIVVDKYDRANGVKTGDRLTVTAVEGGAIKAVKQGTNEVIALPLQSGARFVSYDYAETVDRSQGATYEAAVAIMSSKHSLSATEARAYVAMSRATTNLTFVTNDTALLVSRLNGQTGLNHIASQELAANLSGAEKAQEDAKAQTIETDKTGADKAQEVAKEEAARDTAESKGQVEPKPDDKPDAAKPVEPEKMTKQHELEQTSQPELGL